MQNIKTTFLDLNNTNRLILPLALKVTCFLLICFLAWLWGWKTSGVLENTMLFDINPLGYTYWLESPHFGPWLVNRESTYYLNGMQGFLGVPNTYINIGNAYEISRTFYCLLLRSFWFLEPILASFVLDIILWFLAALSAAYIAATFSNNKLAPWLAALSVVFGQGFLHSVGEGMPHVLGYAGGFYVGALICLFRTWQKNCSFGEDLVIYIFLALWQIGYGTALFFLPLALLCTWHRLKEQKVLPSRRFSTLALYTLISILPFSIITNTMRLITKMSGEMGMILQGMKSYPSVMAYLISYAKVFADGFLSLGPILTIAAIWLIATVIKKKYKDLQWLSAVFLIQYLTMIFLIVPLAGRGYATYNLILIPIIFFALALSSLMNSINIQKHQKYGKLLLVCALMGIILYPNSTKFGFREPNFAFHAGWFSALTTQLKTYEIHLFQ